MHIVTLTFTPMSTKIVVDVGVQYWNVVHIHRGSIHLSESSYVVRVQKSAAHEMTR